MLLERERELNKLRDEKNAEITQLKNKYEEKMAKMSK